MKRRWGIKGEQPQVKSAPTRAKIGYFGLVNMSTGALYTKPAEKFKQDTFIDFLETALTYTKGKLIILLDNARWHHARAIQQFVAENGDRLCLLFLPPYSPELNPIERVWRLTRCLVTHNVYFPTLSKLAETLRKQFRAWNKANATLRTLCAI